MAYCFGLLGLPGIVFFKDPELLPHGRSHSRRGGCLDRGASSGGGRGGGGHRHRRDLGSLGPRAHNISILQTMVQNLGSCIALSHIHVGSFKVGSFHAAPIKLLYARQALWEWCGMGAVQETHHL